MCSGVKKVFDAVAKLVKKIWNVIRKYLVYIVILVAVFYPYLWPMVSQYLPATWVAWLTPAATSIWGTSTFNALLMRGVVALGIGFLIDKETTLDVVDKVADAAKDTAETVTKIIGGATEGVLSGIISSPVGLLLGAGLIWFFFLRDKHEQGPVMVTVDSKQPEPVGANAGLA